ncbi:MAG: hypothetical protein Q7S58_12750 [Candidatus Binatus sp.]|uniref:DUF2231 domain-containing protein n=1 Tax=Candidatus Binatus sp. TaxID=2811406 RepID=UPI0027172C30|nr:DUF2231 domain-containing protein [Candidatus Binatus sp.]MDO8433269.1 hypothetical protein [Candidatus Binatus sp.]
MEAFEHYLSAMQLHPVVDHFSVSLLMVAVLLDLIASMASTRLWLRYSAVTLMILGALAAGGSFFTGDMEADRIWNALGAPAKEVLKRHAELGEYLAIAFGVLALWRLMIETLGFMAGSRMIYLIVALVAVVVLGYSAHLGGVLVYDYGAGTALMAGVPVPNESASPSATPAAAPTTAGPIPTVSVPTPAPTTAAPSASGAAAESPPASAANTLTPSATSTPASATSM